MLDRLSCADRLAKHARLTLVFAVMLTAALVLGGCKRPKTYGQETPDETVKSAVQMVKDGQAKQLSRLIYAETPEMRAVLDRLGVLLGNLQALSVAAAKRWPDELTKLQAKALEDSQNSSGMLAGLLAGQQGRDGKGMNPDAIRGAFNALLADPYGWLERNGARLSAATTSDDSASVLIDGQPAIPVIGLPMRRDGSKWYVAIPSNMPPMNTVWPRTREQWSILGSLVTVLNNSVVALTKDVEGGKLKSLQELVNGLQEKAMFPAIMAFGAYGREMDVRQRVDRRMRMFQTRWRAWVKARSEVAENQADTDAKPGVSPKFAEAVNGLALVELERLVRTNKPTPMDKMTDQEFEELVGGWMSGAGLSVKLDGPLTGEGVERAVGEWTAAREKAKTAPKPAKKK